MLANAKILGLIIILTFGLLLNSCGNKNEASPVLNEVISLNNLTDIATKIKEDKSITKEEIELFANGVARLSRNGGDSLVGKTVGYVIDAQKQAQLEASYITLTNSAMQAEINICQKLQLTQFGKKDSADQKTNVISFKVSNLSDKTIKNLQGYLNILNQNNQIVKRFPINIMKPLEPGKSYDLVTPPYKHDDANENDITLRTPGVTLKPFWQAILVEFEGGKKLGPIQ